MDPEQRAEGAGGGAEVERALHAHVLDVCRQNFNPRELRKRGEAGVEEIAAAALPLLRQRHPGEIGVRVHAPGGRRGGRTALEVTLSDLPFLVDTFRLAIRRLGLREMLLLHVLLDVERGPDGRVRRAGPEAAGCGRESYMYAEVPLVRTAEETRALEQALARVFAQVRDAVADHAGMVRAIREHAAEIEFLSSRVGDPARGQRVMSFLQWLADDNFVFLGYRRYRAERAGGDWTYEADPASGLGILRDVQGSRFSHRLRGAKIPESVRGRLEDVRLVFFDKSRTESSIHREGRLDCITVKTLDETGLASGFGKFLGLLTHKAIRTRPSDLPLLAYRRQRTLEALEADPGSHIHKASIEAYDSLPIEFLFSFDVSEITAAVRRVLATVEHQRVEVYVGTDPRNRSFFVSVILPRRAYDENLRRTLERLLRTHYGATYVDHRSSFLDDDAALIHFFCSAASDVKLPMLEQLERDIEIRVARWEDLFEQALLERHPAERAYALADDYAALLPESYRFATTADEAVLDVDQLERLRSGEAELELRLSCGGLEAQGEGAALPLKVFLRARPYLTDLLPVLDHFGLCVIDATLTEVRTTPQPLWIVTFRVKREWGEPGGESETRLLAGLRAALRGEVEDDGLNALILGAGLDWREADVLRAYLALARQLGTAPDRAFAAETLLRRTDATRALVDLFRRRFDPACVGSRAEQEAAALARLATAREPIPTSAEDRVFGLLENLIRTTLRTDFFTARCEGLHELSFKLDSSRIENAPAPRPYAEIFVHSPEFAGVHLRGGRVARGGIRWSDRLHDFRSEILGLMKTQMVKNGLIVPVGSKGGFVLKRHAASPAQARQEADRIYARFMRRLLGLTDNLVGDAVVPPPGVVRHDGDDPYLVVAADKGTAHLSDTANAVAAELGFWLDDAFASGGSHGYDHKQEGITARGAWLSVRRHFLELGIDVERQSITIAGVGDMSGDVFGNGMQLARTGKLVAAFNHLHVFLDPDPDPERAWQERQRLFELPHSSWRDYVPDCISAGGGVWERSARSIPLAPRVRQLLGLERESLSGEELVQAILRMPVDLLWLGGIGTYVKASRESHADVGDRANDAVRIDACELHARVVGEGANLGMTQLARVEYALCGGRSNTDAVDNSAGVDLSDHEVNFKVLLSPRPGARELPRAERDAILRECVGDASCAVLEHNDAQIRCLSLDRLRVEEDPERFVQAAVWLARHAGLDWRLEFLPEREELRARVTSAGRPSGYVRPELAILLGYSKMLVKRALADSALPAEPLFRSELFAYFPERLRERFATEIQSHRLAREITASCLTNRMLDRAGVTVVPELTEATGASIPEVVGAYHGSDRLLEAESMRRALAAQPLPEPVRLRALLRIEEAVRAATRSRLGLERASAPDPEELAHWTEHARALRRLVGSVLAPSEAQRLQAQVAQLGHDGLPDALASELATLPWLARSLGAISLANALVQPLERVLAVHARVGSATRIAWLLERLESLRRCDGWDRVAAESLYTEMLQVQQTLTLRALEADSAIEPLAPLRRAFGHVLQRIEETAQHIESEERGGLAPLAVLSQQIRRLC